MTETTTPAAPAVTLDDFNGEGPPIPFLLSDYFAGQALADTLDRDWSYAESAKIAYDIADAMLAERAKRYSALAPLLAAKAEPKGSLDSVQDAILRLRPEDRKHIAWWCQQWWKKAEGTPGTALRLAAEQLADLILMPTWQFHEKYTVRSISRADLALRVRAALASADSPAVPPPAAPAAAAPSEKPAANGAAGASADAAADSGRLRNMDAQEVFLADGAKSIFFRSPDARFGTVMQLSTASWRDVSLSAIRDLWTAAQRSHIEAKQAAYDEGYMAGQGRVYDAALANQASASPWRNIARDGLPVLPAGIDAKSLDITYQTRDGARSVVEAIYDSGSAYPSWRWLDGEFVPADVTVTHWAEKRSPPPTASSPAPVASTAT